MLNFIGRAFAQPAAGSVTVPVISTAPISGSTATLGAFVGAILTWALWAAGAIAVIFLIYGGVLYITAGGDQEKATSGRTAIVNAIIGIIVIALALVLVNWANTFAVNPSATH